jgi:hypothetical protein
MMRGNDRPARDTYVPTSFADLRRTSGTSGSRVTSKIRSEIAPPPGKSHAAVADLADLAVNPAVMKQSKAAILVALAIFMMIGGLIYYRPFLETLDAFNTAGAVAANKAGAIAAQTKGSVGSLGKTLATAKDVDTKAVNIGLKGVGCLNKTLTDQKACPN